MSLNQAPRVAVLLSVGQHPVTRRPRRADQDARALELALNQPNTDVVPIHVGQASSETEVALRSYLGMGVSQIDHLEVSTTREDILPSLAQHLKQLNVQVVLCGTRAETGEGSGLVPYLLAKKLGWPIVSGLASIESIASGSMTFLQALPRGQRRRVKVSLPAVVAVDPASPPARQSAFGPAQRGDIQLVPSTSMDAEITDAESDRQVWQYQVAKKRPKRLKIIKATSARDRFKAAAAKADASGGKVLQEISADSAAEEIIKLLKEEGVLSTNSSS